MTNGRGKSDSCIVPAKSPNKAGTAAAEAMEGRRLAKGNSYGVPSNGPRIGIFRKQVAWLWWRTLKRRSQSHPLSWRRMAQYVHRWFPPARTCHPQPLVRLGVITQGKSRTR
jgi:hypothetical protein